MKIGILGGSFDPLHLGHIALAETAKKALNLDKVLFLPSGNHPFKKNTTILSAEKRYELVSKALKNYPGLETSRLDMVEDKTSYTSDLVRSLQEIYSEDELFMIAGDDIVAELPNWYEWKWLLENIQFVIAQRPETDRDIWDDLDYLEYFTFIKMPQHDISSTEIRRRIKQNKDISGLVPESILSEIKKYYK
ncbi:MAG: nicotinate-nucleotide adenylyltransferase [Candidatus Cloacimonetes bacterium]|nr:nicotinate-nucleotide adenylyltransferase [Candidatus Cloacimonadota bacterium]MCF7814275.1 nicotinate-nucleotide adenylyltransferase [Candidatus Cloacimonadota bacterium]MCF7868936.1 nicotinate-nucleotide adenylyltransferase [Candidatus Cloacimonadota bacterium]MCF7884316.1 nicotinate-nucleotide adenylyltransferase [Candidatus Cloacimonadota bacterium]